MAPDCAALALAAPWHDDVPLLVARVDALRLCRGGGFACVPAGQALRLLDDLPRREMASARGFLGRVRLANQSLRELSDAQALASLRSALRTGDLAVIRKTAEGDLGSGSAEQRRLVRAIGRLTRGKLGFGGAHYRLVADVDVGRLPDRDSYHVVRHEEGVKVLRGIAAQAGAPPELRALLEESATKLAADWRRPLAPDGLVLLRRVVVQQAVNALVEVMTPSQMKKALTKTDWIEIQVTDELGKPYRGAYEIVLTDGSTAKGQFDAEGLWGKYDIDAGTCTMAIPDLPGKVKPGVGPSPTDTSWVAVKLVDEDGQPLTGRSYRLALADGQELGGVTRAEGVRVSDIPKGTCVFTLVGEEAPGQPAGAGADVPLTDDTPGDGVLDAIAEDAEGNPIVNHPFEAHFADGTVMKGRTDGDGHVHLEGCPGDACTLRLLEVA
jgi:hypothetical protein